MSKKEFTPIAEFVRFKRKQIKITQIELADKAGVGLRFVRDLEQNKKTLRVDKVNDVLILFGYELAPVQINREKLIGNE
jgi:y4mF family transcriptional regulator